MLKKWIKPELVNIITVEAGKAVVGTEMKSQTTDNYGHKLAHAYKTWNATGLVHAKKTSTFHVVERKISSPLTLGLFTIHFTNTPASKQSGPS